MAALFFLATHFLAQATTYPVGATFTVVSDHPIWISDKSVLRAAPTKEGYVLTTKKTGVATYRLGAQHIRLRVISKQRHFQFKALKSVITNSSATLHIEVRDFSIGGVLDLDTWKKLFRVALLHGIKYQLRAEIRDSAQTWLNLTFGERGLSLPTHYDSTTQELHFGKSSREKEIRRLTRALGLHPVFNPKWQPPSASVEFELQFAEISNSLSRQLGMEWPQSIHSNVLADLKQSMVFHALQSESEGRIFARPVITSINGGKARFHSGGEFPIRYQGRRSYGVNWKPYGLTIELEPQIFGSRIKLQIQTELSYPDGSAEIDGVPGIKRSTFSSILELHNQKTLFVSGLVHNQHLIGNDGLAHLSQIPILGRFFSLARHTRQSSELVLFITPRIL